MQSKYHVMQLHYYPGNASFIPHAILRELGAEFDLIRVDRENHAHRQPEYLALNPSGRIPVLVDGDLVLFETAAIALHLADTHPEAGLAPPLASAARATFYKWLMFMADTIQPDVLVHYYPHRYTTAPEGTAGVKAAADQRLMDWHAIIEQALGAGPWFLGDEFSVLDIYLTLLARWGRFLPVPPASLPRTGALARRVLARPAVAATVAAEGITGDFLSPA